MSTQAEALSNKRPEFWTDIRCEGHWDLRFSGVTGPEVGRGTRMHISKT